VDAADPARLLALAEAVADGRPVDWATASDGLPDEERALIDELRLLADVGQVHRAHAECDAKRPEPAAAVDRWGPLEIRGRIGAGQFGTVFRAWEPRLEREVALKLIDRPATAGFSGAGTIHEGRLLARVRHPHVITVFGADEFDGRVGIWMELIHGSSLEAVAGQRGLFSAAEAAVIGADLCAALAAVHAAGLVHRDVKAQNVMRESGGRIVLMDFGAGETIALRGQDRRMIGTPLYMAPELFNGAPATPASDIYSVGVLLYWIVSGLYPVVGRSTAEVQAAAGRGEQRRLRDERPDLPAAFLAIVERSLAADPRDRYGTAGELEAALRRFVGAVADAAQTAPNARTRSRVRRRLAGAAIATAAIAALSTAGWWAWRGRAEPVPGAPMSVQPVRVLPFVNLSGDPANDQFVVGLVDVLVSRLGAIASLRVSTGPPAEGVRPPAALAGAASIAGGIDRQGNRLRVNVRLLQAGTGEVTWSDSYEGAVQDAFALQGQIARDVAKAFRLTLSGAEQARLDQSYRPHPDAQDAYLRARSLMHRQERAALIEARQLLERAMTLDSGYQLAFAAAARCYISLQAAGVLTPEEAARLARQTAQAALAIQDNEEAELALAQVMFSVDRNWAGADLAFRRALDLNPSFSAARSRFSRYLAAAGRTGEAVAQARVGLDVDPLSLEMHEALAMALYYDGQFEAALAAMQASSSIAEPSATILGRIHSALGDQQAALRYIRAAYERVRSPALLAEEGRIEAVAGNRARAEAILAELQTMRASGVGYVFPGDVGYILVALGSAEEALGWLELAEQEGAGRLLWLRVDPRVAAVRDRPRFQQLLRRIGP
jgi:serine/threonine-protein kinase